MAKIKVFSRYPNPTEFRFGGYLKTPDGGVMVAPVDDADRIVLNGTTEIVNHTLVTHEGALTLFGTGEHNVEKRLYTTEDFERLKENPLFKQMLKNGSVSIGSTDDLSKDYDGVGMLSAGELKSRNVKSSDGDALSVAS